MRLRLPLLGLAAALALAAAQFSEPARACAPAPRAGQAVSVADETAVILWDPATGTEHFVRRASFRTDAKDFGFLVPTPSKPELAEVKDGIFPTLEDVTAPAIVTKQTSGSGCGCGTTTAVFGARSAGNAPEAAVRVLDAKRLAGQDVVVLEADDAGALAAWLKGHGYEFSPALVAWADHYVKAGWKFTAFKYAADAETPREVNTNAVRLTFKTDKPLYPYKEPVNQFPPAGAPGPRLLRVYFLGDARVDGARGPQRDAWPGRAVWAKPLAAPARAHLLGLLNLPETAGPASMWLTEFEDRSSPRPATDDVFFAKTADGSTLERPPVVHYVRANDGSWLVLLAAGAAVLVPRYLGKRRQSFARPTP